MHQQASEETFYNLKRLHVWFAVSALALVGVTVWLILADHRREWKVYQRRFVDEIEPWLIEAEIRARLSEDYAAREAELRERLVEAQGQPPTRDLVERFLVQLRRSGVPVDAGPIEAAHGQLVASPDPAARRRLLERADRAIRAVEVAEENARRRLRRARAELGAARSDYEVAAGRGEPAARLAVLQRRIDRLRESVEQWAERYERIAVDRKTLAAIRAEMTAAEQAARKALEEHRAEVAALRRALVRQRPSWGKRLLRLPLIEALGRPLEIRQIWPPELTIDYNFRFVARCDRCVTCHLGIDKLAPGTTDQPRCPPLHRCTVELPALEDLAKGSSGRPAEPESRYGFSLAPRGLLDPRAPTVGLVSPRSLAARAGLAAGDAITHVNGKAVSSVAELRHRLSQAGEQVEGVRLSVRRGLPHPYASHPRLDLFVGSESPHPAEEFGCTICHDGQGSATAFRFASHTPNDPRQRQRWQRRYDWFFNPHWPYPMLPARLAEARCLKCHHDVTDLEPSRRFLDAPAPTLVAGYHLIRQLGCFGCHEIRGVDEDGRRVGPDMRLEPNYHEAALQLLATAALSDEQGRLATALAARPYDEETRRRLSQSLEEQPPSGLRDPDFRRLLALLSHRDSRPGTMRKVGPSLRHVAQRLDARVLDAWVRDPAALRPATRMPAFYGLHEHLEGSSLEETRRLETVEVYCITEYLLAASQPAELPRPPEGVTEPASADRGRRLFQLRGCLACHRHQDFPEAESDFGPDLSDLGSKLKARQARRWLAGWLRDPAGHRPRTRMPNPLLEPTAPKVDAGNGQHGEASEAAPRGADGPARLTDPAADIAEYLLSSDGWKVPPRQMPSPEDVDRLALMHLAAQFPKPLARQYLQQGIPPSLAQQLDSDTAELLAPITRDKKVRYVARRTIRMRGCSGCHDIPGFEDARLIGPALSEWGRKPESLLAFEQVHRFVQQSEPPRGDTPGAFFREALLAHRREGFLWQKLRAPRSFDYRKAENKSYLERLTMGRFRLDDSQREAIITFVMGLVAQPPSDRHRYHPDRRRRAIIEGRKVLDRYGCAECHILRMERWAIRYDPQRFEEPVPIPEFDFIKPQFSADELARSARTDHRGWAHAQVVGMPRLEPSGGLLEDVDDEDNPLYFFGLWEPAVIGGQIWPVAGAEVPIAAPQITRTWPAWGGRLARILYPVVLAEAWQAGSAATDLEAWGWLPPPLEHEGRRVRPEWLYGYLLDPLPLRPAAVLPMPKYTLTPREVARLVDYFAAMAGADFPYGDDSWEPATSALPADERARRRRQAMRLVTDRTTFCAKCHLIGDYTPGDQVRTSLAPRLDRAGQRLRPEALRRWLANPKSVLPYTGMPVNFPPEGPPLGQDLLPGTSLEQIDAVADLLLHYPEYLGSQISIRRLIESAGGADQAEGNDR